MPKITMIVGPKVRLNRFAIAKEVAEIVMPIIRLKTIICFADVEKILAIEAGKIRSAVISKIPTICTEKAMVRLNKIRKDAFHLSVLIPEIFARSGLALIKRIFLKAKIE